MATREEMLQVARLSFVEGKNNKEIAAILRPGKEIKKKTNLTWVQDLLDESVKWLMQREARLVVREDVDTEERQLSIRLCEKFQLLDARVVQGGDIRTRHDYAALLKSYASAGADYLDATMDAAQANGEELHIAVSGGQSILDSVTKLTDLQRPNVHYYVAAIIGRNIRNHAPIVSSVTNATLAWSRSGRLADRIHYGTVPPYEVDVDGLRLMTERSERHESGKRVVLQQMRDFCKRRYVTEALAAINENVNMALAGLGLADAPAADARYGPAHIARLTMTGLLKPFGIEPSLLAKEGAVGDLAYCLFDKNGKGRDDWKFFITAGQGTPHTGVEFYRNLVKKGRPVMVIGGTRKEAALMPALKGKLCNVLVTDAFTAKKLLNLRVAVPRKRVKSNG